MHFKTTLFVQIQADNSLNLVIVFFSSSSPSLNEVGYVTGFTYSICVMVYATCVLVCVCERERAEFVY